MVNAMQKRKKSRRGCVSISMNQRGLRVGALFGRDKRHSRAMTVTINRATITFDTAACHRLKRCDSQFAARKRDDFQSFRSRVRRELLLEDV